jgi:dinuclear metal center YbgI/SA1388 family protein
VAPRDEIVGFCDDLLRIGEFRDYGPNGLQVPGKAEVGTVATAVSAHLESIEGALQAGADLLLVHHGLFWDFHPRSLSDQMAARLRAALGNGLSVAGYHLPLDAHPEIGNNALVCRQLGFKPEPGPIGIVKGSPVGMIGRTGTPPTPRELAERIETELGRAPLVFADGPGRIESLGVVTGAAASEIHSAIGLGLDAFLTGEPSEHVMADSREGRVNFFAAGHYATETAGIRRLGELIAGKYGVEHTFVDVPNPI